MSEPETNLSPLGKAGEEVAGFALAAGAVGVAILAPGLVGYWLVGDGPMLVRMLMGGGARVALIAHSAFLGTLCVVGLVGDLEALQFRRHPEVLRGAALAVSAAVGGFSGLFGFLIVLGAAAVLWREWVWKRRGGQAGEAR